MQRPHSPKNGKGREFHIRLDPDVARRIREIAAREGRIITRQIELYILKGMETGK